VKPEINSVEVHPQLSHKGHPVDGVLVGAGSVYPNGMDHSTPEEDEPGLGRAIVPLGYSKFCPGLLHSIISFFIQQFKFQIHISIID
jgi:hypothetical protein